MLLISVHNAKQNEQLEHAAGPIEFGRGRIGTLPRCVIDDRTVSRDHLRVEEGPTGRVRVRNLSTKNPVTLDDGLNIPMQGERELSLPLQMTIGSTTITIEPKGANAGPSRPAQAVPGQPAGIQAERPVDSTEHLAKQRLESEGFLSISPVQRHSPGQALPRLAALGEAPTPERLTQWMETVLGLQRSDAGPTAFFAQAAQAIVNLVGLDIGLVLLHRDTSWQVVARAAAQRDDNPRVQITGREFSHTVLRHVMAQKQTFYQDLGLMQSEESLVNVGAVVVSPVFGQNDEVTAVLYGSRSSLGRPDCKIRPLEAQLVQLLAAAVGANMARTAATRTRTQFEQFFSAELVRELERDPGLLEGRGQDVTILMSDLRDFSNTSERIGPQQTCQLIRDLMEALSRRIDEQGGVIVSYLGDGMLAMWNAPSPQENHAGRACQSALAMLRELPGLNDTWQAIVGHPLQIGIGINSGLAQVGNTGSSRKFMYGPLGNTVNLASRVERATKYFKLPVLLTGSTRAQLGDAFHTRRLCQVRVSGIHGAVDLYELHGETATPEWLTFRDTYEAALALFESRQWFKACQILLPLMEQGSDNYDTPTLKLMNRSWSYLEAPPENFDPVLDLSTK